MSWIRTRKAVVGNREKTWSHDVLPARVLLSIGASRDRRVPIMHSYMHQVFEAVMDLEPRSPSTTPGTRKYFENTQKRLNGTLILSPVTSLAFGKPLELTTSFNGMNQRYPRPGLSRNLYVLFRVTKTSQIIFLGCCESVQPNSGAG